MTKHNKRLEIATYSDTGNVQVSTYQTGVTGVTDIKYLDQHSYYQVFYLATKTTVDIHGLTATFTETR